LTPFGERNVDVILMQQILGQLLLALGALGLGKPLEVCGFRAGIATKARGARCQDQAEEVIRLRGEDGVGLRLGKRRIARDLGKSPQVISLIDTENTERFVCLQCHGEEEANAVIAASLGGAHDPIVEPFRALGGRKSGDVRRTRSAGRLRFNRRLTHRTAPKALAGRERDEREQCNSRDCPRKRIADTF
jgi:hypothetical protein